MPKRKWTKEPAVSLKQIAFESMFDTSKGGKVQIAKNKRTRRLNDDDQTDEPLDSSHTSIKSDTIRDSIFSREKGHCSTKCVNSFSECECPCGHNKMFNQRSYFRRDHEQGDEQNESYNEDMDKETQMTMYEHRGTQTDQQVVKANATPNVCRQNQTECILS